MNQVDVLTRELTRRAFLGRSSAGMGALALASLLDGRLLAKEEAKRPTGVVNPLHFPAKAKRMIYLYDGRVVEEGVREEATIDAVKV